MNECMTREEFAKHALRIALKRTAWSPAARDTAYEWFKVRFPEDHDSETCRICAGDTYE